MCRDIGFCYCFLIAYILFLLVVLAEKLEDLYNKMTDFHKVSEGILSINPQWKDLSVGW